MAICTVFSPISLEINGHRQITRQTGSGVSAQDPEHPHSALDPSVVDQEAFLSRVSYNRVPFMVPQKWRAAIALSLSFMAVSRSANAVSRCWITKSRSANAAFFSITALSRSSTAASLSSSHSDFSYSWPESLRDPSSDKEVRSTTVKVILVNYVTADHNVKINPKKLK
ncbi:hypothetical protein HAX54_009199 [Datura stramonium]|uniref:Uncharacterized protein n=1 Tax=Datura stramonium TaxID=4076 RepID=A0ABS8RIR6_DATST|nr:hypothetical protein [Datura stramonium]